MRNYKRYLAAALAATMAVGSSVVAHAANSYVSSSDVTITDSNAADGSMSGVGEVEGNVSLDVFRVVVPACMTGDDTNFNGFDFVLDPQKLITQTAAAKYVSGSNATATDFVAGKTLYFVHKTDNTIDNTSDFVKVTNKSSIDVDITLDAEINGAADIVLSEKDTFADDSTSMYMALTDGTGETAITANGAKVTSTIPGSEDAYEMILNAKGNYEFALTDEDADFKTFEFALTGASNENGDWANLPAGNTPQVDITWSIKPFEAQGPSVAQTSFAKPASGDLLIDVNLGTGDLAVSTIQSITFVSAGETKSVQAANYTFANGKLTLKAAMLANVTADRTFTVTFNNGATVTFTVTV